MKTPFRQAGFTLMEMLIAIAIVAILVSMALPSFNSMLDRQRVRGAAENLFADLQFAKTQAIKCSRSMDLIAATGSPWSYCVATNGSNCAAAATSDCATAGVWKATSGADFTHVTLNANASVTFDALRGAAPAPAAARPSPLPAAAARPNP
ncbi:pilus assembly FimT family protein [Methylogaea oryzae]|uniref:pilus assembly FimT family protein n=1 Tax=Methylogaea oryzae TaxID=1295382 RepID=UPI0006D162D8|nr:GspH/FimT family pseudopilin [Methylogaea oryzae]